MMKVIDFIKYNKKILSIALMLSCLMIFLWISADSFSIGKTEQTVHEYIDWGSLSLKGYKLSGNDLVREKNRAYILIPAGDVADRMFIDADVHGELGISVQVYYQDTEGKYKTAVSLQKGLVGDKGVSIKLPRVSSTIKLVIDGNIDKTISLNKIIFYKSETVFNKQLVFFAGLAFLIMFFLLTPFLYWLVGKCHANDDYLFLIVVVGGALFILVNLLTSNYYWGSYFFANSKGAFMDHFSMLFAVKDGNPYRVDVIYPAMCFIILKISDLFLPQSTQRLEMSSELREDSVAVSTFLFFILFCVVAIFLLLKKGIGNRFRDSKIALLVFTGPLLYAIQRGNIIVLAFCLVLVYFNYYDSDDKKMRYLAYVSLALAASIKVYPAVFGFMTVRKKRYKEAIGMAVVGFMVFAIPFFAYGGMSAVVAFIDGMARANESMTAQGLGSNISLDNIRRFINVMLGVNIPSSTIALIAINLLLIVFALKSKRDWNAWFLLAVVCAWYPVFSYTYVLLMFYPAILAAIKGEDSLSKFDYILLGVLITPIALPYIPLGDAYVDSDNLQMGLSYSGIIVNVVIVYWVIRIVAETILGSGVCSLSGDRVDRKAVICRRIITVILIATSVTFLVFGHIRPYNKSYSFAGDGTSKHPYEISSVDDFKYLVEVVNKGEHFSGAYFVQTADIQFDGVTSIDPIGWDKEDSRFSGVYDGQGHSIINYYSLSPDDQNMGVFGVLDGAVYNLNLKNCSIAGNIVGGVAYEVTTNGKIENCYINGIITGYQVGGVAAVNYGTIENCVAFVNIDATDVFAIAENLEEGDSVNSYSNNNKWNGALNPDTIAKINSHVERSNSSLLKKLVLCNWNSSADYFMVVDAGE